MRRGFTLIELLVVIAIIAILAAILFPVFAKARAKARQTACLSNLRQLDTAMLSYAQDWDETYPCGGYWACGQPDQTTTPAAGPNRMYRWFYQTQPYVKSVQLFYCPERRDGGGGWSLPPGFANNPSYGSFSRAQVANCEPWPQSGRTLGVFGYASETGILADSAHSGDCDVTCVGSVPFGKVAWPWACGIANDPSRQNNDFTAHNGGSNIAFVDGHAKWKTADGVRSEWSILTRIR